jgi:hypothetical protein
MRLRLLTRLGLRLSARPGHGSSLAARSRALRALSLQGRHQRKGRVAASPARLPGRPPAAGSPARWPPPEGPPARWPPPASQPQPPAHAAQPGPGPRQAAQPGLAADRGPGHRLDKARAAVRVKPPPAAEPPAARPAGTAARSGTSGEAARAARADRGRAGHAARHHRQARGYPGEETRQPWYRVADPRRAAEGRRDCGPLERVLCREWDEGTLPPPEVLRAVDRLAELPPAVSERLAAGLEAIHVGPGGVPDLDDMGHLHGVPLPSGHATWDACSGAYGNRKIIIGTRPSLAPDVVCHEVGHALDELDGRGGVWQSDSGEFRALYARCLPRLVSDFHRQEGVLGRREFFADAFAAIASSQRPALVDMLGGDTRTALDVMLYFNLRYGI